MCCTSHGDQYSGSYIGHYLTDDIDTIILSMGPILFENNIIKNFSPENVTFEDNSVWSMITQSYYTADHKIYYNSYRPPLYNSKKIQYSQ